LAEGTNSRKSKSKSKSDSSNSKLDGKLKPMIENLVIDFRAKIPEGQRHNILISVADSILFRHSTKRTEEELKMSITRYANPSPYLMMK
jgi:hypothetical protein